ncbi:MAG: 50S ribosomal protein L5 [Thaumarchaeota archaeon]|nr:50S ribosomal protein L5 [Nitrososphaerota archaeon]
MAEVKLNPMKTIRLEKVVLNIAVGAAGERLEKAAKVLKEITGQEPALRKAKKSIRDFGIHRGENIAAMVTLRKSRAVEVLKQLVQTKGAGISPSSFDKNGNLAFGIKEHIDIPGAKYDPDIGIFGMDVVAHLTKPGYRVRTRRMGRPIGEPQRVSREDAIEFFKNRIGVQVME